MGYKIGIDLGSTAIKIVTLKDKEIVWKKAVPTAPGQEVIATGLMKDAFEELGITSANIESIAATGYGRNLIQDADFVVDEVSANAWGLFVLSGGKARTAVNIGGQDIKVIYISEVGKLYDFKMNDKCAAGTGRFFEMAARIIDTPLNDFSKMCDKANESAHINSTCVVFAESEIVSLIAQNVPKENIIKGLHESISRRIAGMIGEQNVEDDFYLDGGSANNGGLVIALEDELFRDVNVLDYPQFTVAYGAALLAKK